MIYDLCLAAPRFNPWTTAISVFSASFLHLGREYVNPRFKRRYKIPLPLELFLVSMPTRIDGTEHGVFATVPSSWRVPRNGKRKGQYEREVGVSTVGRSFLTLSIVFILSKIWTTTPFRSSLA